MSASFWSDWLGAQGLVWAPRLTAAIYAAVIVRSAKRVIVPNNCCPQVVYALLLAGAEPVFCEVNLENGGLDAHACEMLMKQSRVDMVIHVHLYGLYSERGPIHRLCRRYGAFFFEDAGLWFPPVRGYEVLDDSCFGLSFGSQKIFDFGGGAVLGCWDRSLATEVRHVLQSLPPRPSETSDYNDAYYRLVATDGLPKRPGSDFGIFAKRYRDHWIGWSTVGSLPLDESKVARAHATRTALREKYRRLLRPLEVQFFVDHPLDMPWRFSFLSPVAKCFGIPCSHWYPPLDRFFPRFAKSQNLARSYRLGSEVGNLPLDELGFEASIARLHLALRRSTAASSRRPFGTRVRGWISSIYKALENHV
jgi:DegT/DnrJ/EryC1/StrS aminotransferase family protein